jgi:hypothetical protein
MIKSQVEGWRDWSTSELGSDARRSAEWLIKNGYGNDPKVQSAFYYRQTSSMADNISHAVREDEASIVRLAEFYKNKKR